MFKIASFVAVMALAGCSGSSGKAANPCGANPCGNPCGNPCDGKAKGPDFSAWRTWTKVSSTPFKSKGHQKTLVDVYVSTAADQYKSLSGTMPEGMKIAKVQYKGDTTDEIDKLTVMEKMSAGYDAEHGDWLYGVYKPDGTPMMAGKLKMCISCHDAQGSDTDYVIGVPDGHKAE